MSSLINAIKFLVSLHNFSSSEQNTKGDFTLGELGKCSVVGFHTIPYFHNGVYPTQKTFYLKINPYQTLLKKNHGFKRRKGGPQQENQSPKIESIQ